MAEPKLSALELKIMNELWSRGACSIREVHEAVSKRDRPAYTTVQTMIYRLETKGAVRRTKKIGNAHVFEATTSRASVQSRLVKELLGLFGGSAQPLMAHLVETGKITREDIDDAAKLLRTHSGKETPNKEKAGMISALLDHLWQSTLFCGAVWALTLALRGNRAAVRHGLWVAASVKFLVPFSALFSAGALISFATPADADPPMLGVAAQVAAPVMTPALSIVQVAATPAPLLLNGLLALWIAGALLISWRWFRAWRAAESIARAAHSLPGAPDDVRISDADIEPAVARVFQPVVLLPAALLHRLEPAQLQAVLAHEREHIARRDNLTAHFQRLVEALFWFFPLVWWIGRRQVDERERACDEDVLDRGHDRAAYAEGILAVCRHAYAASSPATSAALSGDLTSRIRDILGSARPHALGALKAAALSIATIAVAAGPLAAGAFDDAARHRDYLVSTEHLLAGATIYIETSHGGADPDLRARPDEINIRSITLRELVAAAYDVPAKRVSGGGSWLDSPRYDIRAELQGSLDDPDEFDPRALRALTNKILASRFDLEIHVNQRCYSPCGREALTANVIGH